MTSEKIIAWIEAHCRVPEGRDVGKPVVLREWQKDEIRRIYDNPEGTRRAIITFGRKNGKTALASFLLLVHLCGPMAQPNSQLYSAAQSRDQAAILFGLASKIVRMSEDLHEFVVVRDSSKQLYCPELGTLYRALSADATTAYGLSPVFAVHDELGQVRGPRSELYEAIETGMSAHDAPLSVIISTQAPTDADLLSQLIDEPPPRTVVSMHTADKELDPFCEETIRLANPAFGDFQNPQEVLDMAEAARKMPTREAEFRNLILNQRVEANNPLIPYSVWKANGGKAQNWGPCYGGLDLSQTKDLTAFVLVSPVAGEIGVQSTFWLPGDGLKERADQDRVPYDVWHHDGYLKTAPGRSVEYEYVAQEIAKAFEMMDIRKIAFDRWNMKHLRPWLVKAGMSEAFIDDRFVDFGQGYQSMSPAIRTMESLLLNEKVRHGMHPVLTMCAGNAIATMDPAGGRKLDKKKSTGRIDGIVALCMALSLAAEDMNDPVFPVDLRNILE